jgi:hypothetical protein
MGKSNIEYNSPDAAEAAFYNAFMKCDSRAMDKVWADGDVVCIHPGSTALVGHAMVIRSWSNILDNSELPNLHYEVVCRYTNKDLTIHVVEEHLMSGSADQTSRSIVLATNIYQRDVNGWHMVEHHASLSRSLPQGTLQ